METNFESIIEKISEQVKSITNTETVIGEEFTIGSFTCKPVIRIGTGFGAGSGHGDDPKSKIKGNGTGGGAGIGVSPVGFLVAKGEEISFLPASNKKGLDAIFEKVPDLMDKIMDMKNKKEKEKEEGKKK